MEDKPLSDLSWDQEVKELQLALSGNRLAVQSIVRRLSKPAFYLAYKTVLNVSDAEDSVQEAFYHLWNSKNQFQGKSSLKTYFLRIVLNACFTALRKRKDFLWEEEENFSQDENSLIANSDAISDSIDIQTAIARLSTRQRTAITLWAYFDYSSKEIGDMMDLNKNAVDQLINRAKQRLRKYLI